MPYRAVILREGRDQLGNPRALLLFLIAFSFLVLAFWQGGERSRQQAESHRSAEAANWAGWLSQGAQNPHAAAHYPMLLLKPPAPLGMLSEGIDAALGTHVFTDAHRVIPAKGTRAADSLLAQAVGGLDASFAVGLVLSLLALLWGVDLVSGEKERGTLRLVFSNALGRRRFFLAKLAARSGAFLLVTGVAAALALVLTGSMPADLGALGRLVLFGLLSMLYLLLWLCLGAACSTLAPRTASAALMALCVWVVLAIAAPRVLVTATELLEPAPPSAPAVLAVRVEEVRLRREQRDLVQAEAVRSPQAANAVVASEGSSEIRSYIDGKAARARAEAEAPILRWRERQLARLSALAYATPTAIFFEAASSVAGTDWKRHADFVAQAGSYRQRFLGALNGLEDAGHAEYSDYAAMERFAYQEAPWSQTGRENLPHLLYLLLFGSAAAVVGLAAFRRYDMR